MIEFGLGAASVVGAEFLLAHAYLWWSRSGSNNAVVKAATSTGGVFRTAETDVVNAFHSAEADVEAGASRVESFFSKMFKSTPVPAVTLTAAPVPAANVSSNATPATA